MNAPLLETVRRQETLPTLSPVSLELARLCARERVDPKEIALVADRDPAIAARLVRMANAPLFGSSRRVAGVEEAFAGIGPRSFRTAGLISAVVEAIGGELVRALDAEAFRRDALATALASSKLSQSARTGRREEAFLAGLVQDVGVLALAANLGEPYAVLLEEADGNGGEVATLERSRFDLHHGEAASALLEAWSFPAEIRGAVGRHPDGPAERPPRSAVDRLTACLYVAESVRRTLRRPEKATVAELRLRASETLEVDESGVSTVLEHVRASLAETAELLGLRVGSLAHLPEIHRKAEDLLLRASARTA